MGRTERKLKKKTRLERLEVYISRLSQFNSNAMHEVGKLAAALRYYADGSVWEGVQVLSSENNKLTDRVAWKPKEDGPAVARAVLNSLGLPWDKFPTKDGQPADPQQAGVPSVLKSISQEMKAEEAGLAEDDKSQYGRYTDDGGVEKIDPEHVVLKIDEPPKTKAECDDQDREKYNAWAEHGLEEKVNPLDVPMEAEHGPEEIAHKTDDGIPPEEK